MLARLHRITKDKEYAVIFRQGKNYYSPSFTIKYLLANHQTPRLGIVVSKSKIAKAVLRNQSKRRLRAIFWEFWPKLAMPYDIVVIVKKDILTQDYLGLKQEIMNFFKNKRIIQ